MTTAPQFDNPPAASVAARRGPDRPGPDHPFPRAGRPNGTAPPRRAPRVTRPRTTPRCTAGPSSDLSGFWRASPTWFEVRFATPYETVLGRPRHARRPMVPRRHPQLRRTRSARRRGPGPRGRSRAAARRRDPAATARSAGPNCAARSARSPPPCAALGVRPGDRVSGYLPNIPQAAIALLATAAVGAVWTSCAPDFGARSVLDRFQQVEPVVLFTVDGYRYGGKSHDRGETVAELRRELPTVRAVVHIPLLGTPAPDGALDWDELVAEPITPVFEQVPFDHPLWVLYSSGTTGLPKAIVQSQGGILLEHLKQLGLHCDLGPGDRFFWYTSTGWMMWNFLVSGLLVGATVVLYDGSPGYPDVDRPVADRRAHRDHPLRHLSRVRHGLPQGRRPSRAATSTSPGSRCVATTGSPLPPDGFRWLHDEVAERTTLWIASVSGGTDVCSCFAGAVPTLPVHIGELQAACLGTDLQAWDPHGRPVIDEVGELVVTAPDAVHADLASGTTPTAAATATATSRCSPACGGTATGSPSPRAAASSSTAAPTPRSTGRGCGWARPTSTRPSSDCRRSANPWSSVWSSPTAATGCRCSCTSPRAPHSTTRYATGSS